MPNILLISGVVSGDFADESQLKSEFVALALSGLPGSYETAGSSD